MKPRTSHALSDEAVSLRRAFVLMVVFVVIVALLGGGSRYDVASVPWLRALAILAMFGAMALTPASVWRPIRAPLILMGLLISWVAIQLIPLPPELWSALPLRDKIFAIDQLLGAAERWRPITMSPALTINALLSLSVPLAGLFVAAALPARERARLWWAIWAFGLASVAFGLLQFMAGPRSVFYLYRITNDTSLVGLFANRNHHGLMLSLSILAAGWLIANEIARRNRRPLVIPALIGSIAIFLLFTLIIGSRMGLIGGVASSMLVYAIVRWSYRFAPKSINQARTHERTRHTPAPRLGQIRGVMLNILPLVLVPVLGVLFYFSGRDNTVGRFLKGDGVEEIRVATFSSIAALLKEQWLFGSGFGSFARVYQVMEPDALLQEAYLNHAHNDWLQLPIEGGLPAVLIFVAGGVWIAFKLIASWRSCLKPLRVEVAENVTLAAAFAVLVAGSAVDYPLRTPSIAMMAVFLVVILVGHRAEVSRSGRATKASVS